MKPLKQSLPLAIGALFLAASAQAAPVTIDFGTPSDAIYNTADPIIGSVSFWAGDAIVPNDTYVDDSLTPGNNYLMSGVADGTGNSPASGYDTFIGVSKSGAAFASVSFNIASDYNFPNIGDNTTLMFEAYSGATLVGSGSIGVSDSLYYTLSLASSNFDKLFIFDDLNNSSLGEPFHIDNFTYTEYVPPCTGGPNCGGNPVPEPSVLMLLGVGLAGLGLVKRRKSV